LREEKRKLEEENKLFALVNAKQMTMIESLEETVDSDVVNSEKRLRLEVQRSQEREALVFAEAYCAKLALEKMDGLNSSLESLNNPDCDMQANLLRSAMRKKQPTSRWGLFGGHLGGSMSEVGT
jgi:hypothetical protein